MKALYSPRDIVRSGLCIGCGICVSQSHREDTRMKFDAYGQLKPDGPAEWFSKPTEEFSKVCPFSPIAFNEDELASELFPSGNTNVSIGRYQSNYVGYVQEDDFRKQGSSGGLITWVTTMLLKQGLIDGVAHVVAVNQPHVEGRFFKYRISRNEQEIRQGAKSRYYPVELSEILQTIREVPGRYAVVAVPCMIKAINLVRKHDPVYRERIVFTLGLFCGHMKSARFVESFAWQMLVPLTEVQQVDFRHKFPDRPANWYNAKLTLKNGDTINKDWWHLKDGDWGAGYFMNNACNYCDDVVAETADISFGDAWVEPYSSDGMGTNVVIVRTGLMNAMIKAGINDGRLAFKEVDATFVEQTQAAGLRQRREGLAYRLSWNKKGIQPVKRVAPTITGLRRDRKLIYRMRFYITRWSHRMFWVAKQTHLHSLYLFWARTAAAVYYGLAYHKGNIGRIRKRFMGLNGD
ncbi:MAG TPA: Coenzyme F420 hydrogenase/dehydrogenase, beta subunit C-terminal domain [Bacteroidales bacterium]|nr:Coenzyme F420 hydrogenase/dehydrogenase, beta subunit C-terminal domain [Bacteroidales bacterium]